MVAVVLGPLQQHLQAPRRRTRRPCRIRSWTSEYASSTKSTPPIAESISSLAFTAVWPRYSPTRSARWASTRWSPPSRPERVEDPAEDARHGGLAGTRGPGEDEVPFRRLDRQPLTGPQPSHVQLRRQRLDLPLDRLQPHHALQLVRAPPRAGPGRWDRSGSGGHRHAGPCSRDRRRSPRQREPPGRRVAGLRSSRRSPPLRAEQRIATPSGPSTASCPNPASVIAARSAARAVVSVGARRSRRAGPRCP